MPLFETRDLAIYASIVGTLNGAWALYHGVIRDRPRIVVRTAEAEAVPGDGSDIRQEIFQVSVSNRGRRLTIDGIARLASPMRGTSTASVDLMRQTAEKPLLEESQSKTFVHGLQGGYSHGDLPTTRWYVVDGAGRIHPLRERFRQRVLAFIFWPLRRFRVWRERIARENKRAGQ
jgi:hypothetical protein